jgi:hypothetical protein
MSEVDFSFFFYYDETSPTCIRWRVSRVSGSGRKKVVEGDMAGYFRKDGTACNVKLAYKTYGVHVVIWKLAGREIPEGCVIDHEDGNPANNRLWNLRAVPQAVNARNRKKASNNRTGITGVSRVVNKGQPYWIAHWRDETGKPCQKWFGVKAHGEAEAKTAAIAHRANIVNKLNQAGAGYTDRHGC